MFQSFLAAVLLLSIGGALGGTINPTNCTSTHNAYLVNNEIDIMSNNNKGVDCTGTQRCEFYAGETYTARFSACTTGLSGTTATYLPMRIQASLLGFPVPEVADGYILEPDVCKNFVADSSGVTQACHVVLDACGAVHRTLKVPKFTPSDPTVTTVDGMVTAEAWVNNTRTGTPAGCVQFPIAYKVLI